MPIFFPPVSTGMSWDTFEYERSGAVSIPNAVDTPLTFQTISAKINPDWIILAQPGLISVPNIYEVVEIYATVTWLGSAAGTRREFEIDSGGPGIRDFWDHTLPDSTVHTQLLMGWVYANNSTLNLRFNLYQDSGAAIDIINANVMIKGWNQLPAP